MITTQILLIAKIKLRLDLNRSVKLDYWRPAQRCCTCSMLTPAACWRSTWTLRLKGEFNPPSFAPDLNPINYVPLVSFSVDYLKETINRHHGIPKLDQVLLVSGGETLQSNARVAKYSAGTDTNPIFMFSKTITDARNPPPPWPSIESGKRPPYSLLATK